MEIPAEVVDKIKAKPQLKTVLVKISHTRTRFSIAINEEDAKHFPYRYMSQPRVTIHKGEATVITLRPTSGKIGVKVGALQHKNPTHAKVQRMQFLPIAELPKFGPTFANALIDIATGTVAITQVEPFKPTLKYHTRNGSNHVGTPRPHEVIPAPVGESTDPDLIHVKGDTDHPVDGMRLSNVGWLKDLKIEVLKPVTRDELTAAVRTVNRYLRENRETYPSIVEHMTEATKITVTLTETVE